jgi:hypothetical protein
MIAGEVLRAKLVTGTFFIGCGHSYSRKIYHISAFFPLK